MLQLVVSIEPVSSSVSVSHLQIDDSRSVALSDDVPHAFYVTTDVTRCPFSGVFMCGQNPEQCHRIALLDDRPHTVEVVNDMSHICRRFVNVECVDFQIGDCC